MAAGSLLALFDDIAALLDDVALMTKTAASKTVGVLGDDLAVNAEQASGVRAERELPVVWAVAKGSLLNKAIIVPIALLLSFFMPWLIMPILMLGGCYLCFEGAEKVFAGDHQDTSKTVQHLSTLSKQALESFERQKIKGAIRTDFVLSIEIIVITLGTVASASLINQFMVLSLIAVLATVGVYGIVALIVKLDDGGLWLIQQAKVNHKQYLHNLGLILVNSAPYLMKALTVIGTVAMFLVGGGILTHTIHTIGESILWLSQTITSFYAHINWLVQLSEFLLPLLFNTLLGVCVGGILLLIVPRLARFLPIKRT